MVRYELGTDKPYEPRPWARLPFSKATLLVDGSADESWNATVRRGPQGPFLELRRGASGYRTSAQEAKIKFDAWSF